MADLPDISEDVNDPLPKVDPNSDVVPFRTTATDPNGQVRVLTGYGQRGSRPMIQPPGGVPVPDIAQGITAAFQNLPVNEAIKATEAAIRYQGLRGYQRDLQGGSNAAQAFAKWGPMLFRTATGIPEAIDRSVPTPITPQQQIQNALNQRKFEAAQVEAKRRADEAAAKANAPSLSINNSTGEIIKKLPGGNFEVVRPANPKSGAVAPLDKAEASITEQRIKNLQKKLDETDRENNLATFMDLQNQVNAERAKLKKILGGKPKPSDESDSESEKPKTSSFKVGNWNVTPVP